MYHKESDNLSYLVRNVFETTRIDNTAKGNYYVEKDADGVFYKNTINNPKIA